MMSIEENMRNDSTDHRMKKMTLVFLHLISTDSWIAITSWWDIKSWCWQQDSTGVKGCTFKSSYMYLYCSSKNFAQATQFARSSTRGNSYHSQTLLQIYFFISVNKLLIWIFNYHHSDTKERLIPPVFPWIPLGKTLSSHKCLPKSESIPEEA